MTSSSRPAPPVSTRPPLLRVLVGLVLLEALLLVGWAAYLVWGLATAEATETAGAVGLVVIALGFAAGLGLGARALWHRRRAARAPLLVWQILQLAVGLPQIPSGTTWAGILLAVPAVVAVALLFHRDVVDAVVE
ncbi:hypothetical protein CLV92_11872 [Kineococcus xinjiangensis]|uniref:Integral membrane protein n=1 Tax=Kineococcus xinjiangensis TaxID=512762 RepID=A0A2S6ICS9_9ACTN|nr:hypothetical protein [Kineococcus xinjiangensis]PPK92028.1 hypothetical protein CLV92_11872 [Kineococcus xinjiangensis]